MVEAIRAAAHYLVERRTRHVLFDWTRQANHQDGVVRNLRWSKDSEIECRHDRSRNPKDGDPDFPVAGRARNCADGTQNRDNYCEADLAAYPQSFIERVFHSLKSVAFFERPKYTTAF